MIFFKYRIKFDSVKNPLFGNYIKFDKICLNTKLILTKLVFKLNYLHLFQ